MRTTFFFIVLLAVLAGMGCAPVSSVTPAVKTVTQVGLMMPEIVVAPPDTNTTNIAVAWVGDVTDKSFMFQWGTVYGSDTNNVPTASSSTVISNVLDYNHYWARVAGVNGSMMSPYSPVKYWGTPNHFIWDNYEQTNGSMVTPAWNDAEYLGKTTNVNLTQPALYIRVRAALENTNEWFLP
jgi:hypothetical protein